MITTFEQERWHSPRQPQRALRVLHVIPHLGSGGAERFVLTLMRKLDPSLYKSRLCVLGRINAFPGRAEFEEHTTSLGYNGSLKRVHELLRCVTRLRQVILDWDADIVHSHLWPAARITALAVRRTRAQHVVHIQDTRAWVSSTDIRSRIYRSITRTVLSGRRTSYVAVSRAVERYNSPLASDRARIAVVPNAVDTDEFYPADPPPSKNHQFRIGVVARFSPEKGHVHLLRAFAQVISTGASAELLLAGDGSGRAAIEDLARQLGIADKVRFIGLVDDVPKFLHALDLFVLPSLAAEGLPLSILEAMATGLPVIATDVAGAAEVIQNEFNGFLVPPGNVDVLTKAILRLRNDPCVRRALGQAALKTARDQYSFGAIAGQISRLYTDLAR